jgi:hypothetical protein
VRIIESMMVKLLEPVVDGVTTKAGAVLIASIEVILLAQLMQMMLNTLCRDVLVRQCCAFYAIAVSCAI